MPILIISIINNISGEKPYGGPDEISEVYRIIFPFNHPLESN